MREYLNGEILRIVIEEAEFIEMLDDGDGGTSMRVQLVDERGEFIVEVPVMEPVAVHRVRPAGGMPKPGEIWRDTYGTEYFVKQDLSPTVAVRLVCARPSSSLWETVEAVNRDRGPLTCVYRPGTDGGGE